MKVLLVLAMSTVFSTSVFAECSLATARTECKSESTCLALGSDKVKWEGGVCLGKTNETEPDCVAVNGGNQNKNGTAGTNTDKPATSNAQQ